MMRSDKKLKLSNSNVKNFPKDFFDECHPGLANKRYLTKLNSFNNTSENTEITKVLQPLKQRIARKIYVQDTLKPFKRINSKNEREKMIKPIEAQSPLFSVRHQKVKSFSIKPYRARESVNRSSKKDKSDLKLKETLIKSVKIAPFVKDSSKSISTVSTFAETLGTPTDSLRSRSIQKRTLLNRRNLQQILNTRQKITYSANNSILERTNRFEEALSNKFNRPGMLIKDNQ